MQKEVLEALDAERLYQHRRWGFRQAGGTFVETERNVEQFLVYMDSYLREAIDKMSRERGDEAARDIIRKVTALGVACLEQNGVVHRKDNYPLNGNDGLPT